MATKLELYQQIGIIQSKRAEIYTQLLNEANYLNDFGIEQLNHYCAEAIPKFQSLSKQIRELETTYNKSQPTQPTNIINQIQGLEQLKFHLVVGYLKKQVEFFSQSCPHNHMKLPSPQVSDDSWKQQIFDTYKIEDKNLDIEAITTTSTTTSTTLTKPPTTENTKPDCNHIHGDDEHDEHQKKLIEAKRNAKMAFLTQLGEFDEQINEIMDEITAELHDLVDE